MNKIELTMSVSEKELKKWLGENGLRIRDAAQFERKIQSAAFRKELAVAMKLSWLLMNEDSDDSDMLLAMFGDRVVEFDEDQAFC